MPRLCAITHVNLHQYLLKSRRNCTQAGMDFIGWLSAIPFFAGADGSLKSVRIIRWLTGQYQLYPQGLHRLRGLLQPEDLQR